MLVGSLYPLWLRYLLENFWYKKDSLQFVTCLFQQHVPTCISGCMWQLLSKQDVVSLQGLDHTYTSESVSDINYWCQCLARCHLLSNLIQRDHANYTYKSQIQLYQTLCFAINTLTKCGLERLGCLHCGGTKLNEIPSI